MKLRFTNKEQIKEFAFEDLEYEIYIHGWDTAFIVDDEENPHSIIALVTDDLEFKVVNE